MQISLVSSPIEYIIYMHIDMTYTQWNIPKQEKKNISISLRPPIGAKKFFEVTECHPVYMCVYRWIKKGMNANT